MGVDQVMDLSRQAQTPVVTGVPGEGRRAARVTPLTTVGPVVRIEPNAAPAGAATIVGAIWIMAISEDVGSSQERLSDNLGGVRGRSFHKVFQSLVWRS